MLKKKTVVLLLCLLVLNLAAISCHKLDMVRGAPVPSSPLPFKVLEPIPLDYGQLVAATPHPDDGHWVALWFQKPDKTIAVVYVNVSQGKVIDRASIPRK